MISKFLINQPVVLDCHAAAALTIKVLTDLDISDAGDVEDTPSLVLASRRLRLSEASPMTRASSNTIGGRAILGFRTRARLGHRLRQRALPARQ